MFIKNYHLLFFFTLLTGTFIAISSNSWFTCWLGLELNLIRIIPLILINLNKNSTEAAIKYFLAQAIASLILIFAITVNFLFSEASFLEITEILIITSLRLKGGLAPLHFWFPQIAQSLNWTQCLIIFTLQKISPLLLIFSFRLKLIFFIRVISSLTGALGGLNQNFVKILIAYSSVAHGGWILLGCSLRIRCWILYFSVYSFLSFTIINFFYSRQNFKITQIFSSPDSFFNKNTLAINMLSLGGLPPLIGFFAKLSVILISLKFKNFFILIPLILRSIISLFFYTRVIYSRIINTVKINFSSLKFSKPSHKILFTGRIIFNILLPSLILLG